MTGTRLSVILKGKVFTKAELSEPDDQHIFICLLHTQPGQAWHWSDPVKQKKNPAEAVIQYVQCQIFIFLTFLTCNKWQKQICVMAVQLEHRRIQYTWTQINCGITLFKPCVFPRKRVADSALENLMTKMSTSYYFVPPAHSSLSLVSSSLLGLHEVYKAYDSNNLIY